MIGSTRPVVSVVIPVFDGERYLQEAIESVRRQNRVPTELIIVDDGSTDRTGEIAKSRHPNWYIHQPNAGTASAMNAGIRHASGSFLAFLDQDDVWDDHKLATQMVVFERNPQVDIVQSWLTQFVSPELDPQTSGLFPGDGVTAPGPIPGTTLLRREAFEKVGPFSTDLTISYFADWMFRAQEAELEIVMLEDVLLRRRLHPTNQGVTRQTSRVEYARVAKAALDRRRGRQGPIIDDR